MGFEYNGTLVTLDNYKNIFKGLTPDVLDEIRLAILDDTAIGGYIKHMTGDSYKLGQFRLAIREMLPAEYLDLDFTGRTMFCIRQAYKLGLDTSVLLDYVGVLSYRVLETLAEFCMLNVDLRKVDFSKVPESVVAFYGVELLKGVPVWLLVDCEVQSEAYLSTLTQGLRLGLDIHPFLSNKWDLDVLKYLFSIHSANYDMVLRYINHKTSKGEVEALVKCKNNGVALKRVAIKDTDGYMIFDEYQLDAIAEVASKGCSVDKVLNPKLSANQILSILN